jgi:hypothetical protein
VAVATGWAGVSSPEDPVRLFIAPWEGGGTMTDHGCIVGAPGALDDGLAPDYVRLLAHELFHIWLGGYLSPDDESLVWFHEGFTEYCAVWHVAASGLASREWFAERIAIMDAETRASEAYGRVAFADPAVSWRDDNGPNETLGYRGGALLAFCADQELRRQGRPGLLQMLADGPAAQAVRIGDQILGCSPARNRPPRIGASVATPYRFGLSCIASGAEAAELDVVRDGAELKLSVAPRLIAGGVRTAYRASKKLDGFFEHRPRSEGR